MLARSRQLEGIFGLLKPFLHVQILICFVDIYQNHGVLVAGSAACALHVSVFLSNVLCGFYARSSLFSPLQNAKQTSPSPSSG